MPIYEFECRQCGHRFEDLVVGGSKPVCRACGGEDLERLLSVFMASSEAMRRSTFESARKENAKVRRDRERAEHAAIYHHDH